MRPWLPASLWVLSALPVAAQTHPQVLPTRDVTVDYHIESSAALPVQDVRIEARAGAAHLRVEQPNSLALLVDRPARHVVMVLAAQHAALSLPWPRQVAQGFDILARARFVRQGSGFKAGLRCTNYDVTEDANHLVACITDDGVVLQADGTVRGKQGPQTYHVAATAVSYVPLDPGIFEVPPGLTHLTLPNLGG